MRNTPKQIPLSELKDDLSKYLRLAAKEEIVITRHGKPAGIFVGFASEDDWFDYKLEHDPRFLQRIAAARDSLKERARQPIGRCARIVFAHADRAMDPNANPFAVLSLIVAPAILTNASSVLALSTGNWLARAVDRARELSKQLEEATDLASVDVTRRLKELTAAENRALLLMRALRSFYAALGGFASAALVSLLGAVLVPTGARLAVGLLEGLGVLAGLVAVAALVHGASLLVAETQIAVEVLSDRAATVRARIPRVP